MKTVIRKPSPPVTPKARQPGKLSAVSAARIRAKAKRMLGGAAGAAY